MFRIIYCPTRSKIHHSYHLENNIATRSIKTDNIKTSLINLVLEAKPCNLNGNN